METQPRSRDPGIEAGRLDVRAGNLVVVAVCALVVGTAVYVLDRPAGVAWLIPRAIYLDLEAGSVFGWLGGTLPSALHVYAFILLTASCIRPTVRELIYIASGWLLVEIAFEVGQLDIVALTAAEIPLAGWLLPRGVFDLLDLLALSLGTLAAVGTVLIGTSKEDTYG